MSGAGATLLRPLLDPWRGLERCLERRGALSLAWVAAGLLVGWWLYVPVHELLHAAACRAAGGRVERLEIAPEYGGAVLGRIFPFVHSGSEYAGRLTGFDTGGSDLVYLATDFGPYLLTLYPGVWLLRRAGRRRWAFGFGAALPLALAPFLSLTGDAYEIGAIVATRLPWWRQAAAAVRGDDVVRIVRDASLAPAPLAWGAVAAALALGTLWAWLTYALGSVVARALGEPALVPAVRVAASPAASPS